MFENAKSWPFQEARSLLAHIAKKGKKPGDVVTFETGYGPSGAPHIGTFAEVVRTLWVMKAFDTLTDGAYKVRLIMFSDDYDAMRKVPDDMPEWLNEHLGEPLSRVPNPYPTMGRAAVFADQDATSFGGANNDLLVQFVDEILKSYDKSQVGHSPDRSRVSFVSATNYYRTGKFNDMLSRIWDNFDKIQAIMLPTLGEERRETYSPFMPMSFEGGRLLQVKTVPSPALPYFVEYEDVAPDGPRGFSCRIHDGHVKLQWKVDWAMRWTHFDVDYEMSGKDLMDSVRESSKICRVLGGTPPVGMTYELFLAEDGSKISKSKGNGFSLDDWLKYGTKESLMAFLFQSPKSAKPIHANLIPKLEDEMLTMMSKEDLGPNDCAWFFKEDPVWPARPDIGFALLLNLAIVSQAQSAAQLIAFFNTTPVTVELPETPTSNVQETQLKIIRLAEERMSRLAEFDTAEVAAGKNVTGYLRGNRPLPKWAEWKVFPRSGSAITLFSVFVPNDRRILFPDIAANDKFWWPAANGIVYCFRYREDAENFVSNRSAYDV